MTRTPQTLRTMSVRLALAAVAALLAADLPGAEAPAAKTPQSAPKAAAPAPGASAPDPANLPGTYYPTGIEPPAEPQAVFTVLGLIKTVVLLLLAAAVFYVTNWTFLDTRFVGTGQGLWGGLVLAGGVAALAAALLVPVYAVGLPLGLILFGGASLAYVQHRNARVTAPLRVLTAEHLARVRRRLAGHKPFEAEMGPLSGVGRDIVFVGFDDLPKRPPVETDDARRAGRRLEAVLHEAVVRGASAVGFVCRPQQTEIRLHMGGGWADGGRAQPPLAALLTRAIKHLAGLDLHEVRKPQEGRLRAIVGGKTYDLRVSTAGTVRGEQIVIRITDVAASRLRLEDIGLSDAHLSALTDALGRRPGLVLLSAPKDSGLTTTLHACLRHFDRYMNNVIAFEPRVNIEIENVTHIPLDQQDGPVAAAEVRSHIRMEPDVVAFDSLYLAEIGQVLAEAAGGHMLVVGIRAADTRQALRRLGTLFGARKPLADHLQIVVNQRLVRLLCPECKEGYRPNPDFLRKANLGSRRVDLLYRPPTRVEAAGGNAAACPKCRGDHYAGRTGLFEIMPIDDEARDMIAQGAAISNLVTHLRKRGMRNLQEEGLSMVIDGRTSIEEVLRAIKRES